MPAPPCCSAAAAAALRLLRMKLTPPAMQRRRTTVTIMATSIPEEESPPAAASLLAVDAPGAPVGLGGLRSTAFVLVLADGVVSSFSALVPTLVPGCVVARTAVAASTGAVDDSASLARPTTGVLVVVVVVPVVDVVVNVDAVVVVVVLVVLVVVRVVVDVVVVVVVSVVVVVVVHFVEHCIGLRDTVADSEFFCICFSKSAAIVPEQPLPVQHAVKFVSVDCFTMPFST